MEQLLWVAFGIAVAAVAAVALPLLVLRDYTRTLETARHVWWMRLVGRRATGWVIAKVLGATRHMPRKWLAARLHREARDKAEALRTGRGLYLNTGARAPSGAVLLAGSSTFTYWNRFAEDLAPLPVVNAAFGGSTTGLVNQHFEPLVEAFAPRVVCYFAGTNDITYGMPPRAAIEGFGTFLQLVEQRSPQTVAVVYLGVNTTPFTRAVGGPARVAAVREVNDAVRGMVARYAGPLDVAFVDLDAETWTDDPECYLWDGHHLDERGHALLGELLRPHLARYFESCAQPQGSSSRT